MTGYYRYKFEEFVANSASEKNIEIKVARLRDNMFHKVKSMKQAKRMQKKLQSLERILHLCRTTKSKETKKILKEAKYLF